MPLHLAGETIDKNRAHALAQDGTLVNLVRGVYVDARDDIDQVVLRHAVRIAAYLYPRAYLSGASAFSRAPTLDGRLFLSGRRNQRSRIRGLEIIQNQAPEAPATVPVIVGDDLGELHLTASSPLQRFLEAFRLRSEHAGAVDPAMRRQMAERLVEDYGDAETTADALWRLARANRWTREAEAAETFLKTERPASPPKNPAEMNLVVAWHGDQIGALSHDGVEWRWTPLDTPMPPLVRPTRPGSLPPFIESLLPEGWLAHILQDRNDREALRSGRRYMSNITVASDATDLADLPADVLEGRLHQFQAEGRFTGDYLGPERQFLEDSFQDNLARIFASATTPRLSGIQIKAPMCLRRSGELIPAVTAPFTHILKPAGGAGFENLAVVEWICLSLAHAAGFETPEVALIDMPDDMPPALLVERFDIRRTENDTQRLALEDFCAVLDLPASAKYDQTIERMARGLRPLSTDPVADIETLFRRAVFAWLVADGDMHLKNVALLKVAEAGAQRFDTVRMSPVYDAVTTQVFPGMAHDRMALLLNGKNDNLTPNDFLALANTIGLSRPRAAILMAGCARSVVDAAPTLPIPDFVGTVGDRMRDRIAAIALRRADPFL